MIRIAEGAVHSLSEAQPDQWVRVQHILYDALREYCGQIELQEGDRLLCRSNRQFVVLRSESGRSVIVPQDRARFIRVRDCRGSVVKRSDRAAISP